jgi:phytol kinase
VPLANGVRLVAIGSKWVDNPAAVKAISRSGDSTELLRGPLYYVLVMIVATVTFWRTSPVGLVVISLMCFGDGFADVAGRRWGRDHKWAFNPDKSYAGSAAMFVGGLGCAAALLAAFSAAGYVSVSWQTAAPALVAITAAATLVEALPLSDAVDDNISVPSVAMVLAALML